MSIFKKEPNPVGRPSNEEIKKRRNKKIIIGVIAVVGLVLIGGGAYLLISGTSLSELMGNSVTKTVKYCPNGYYYNKENKACFVKNSNDGTNARPVKTVKMSNPKLRIYKPSERKNDYFGIFNGKYLIELALDMNFITKSTTYNRNNNGTSTMDFSSGYELYKYINGKWTKVDVPFYDAFTLTTIELSKGEVARYRARAYVVDFNGKKVYSNYSNVLTINTNKYSS